MARRVLAFSKILMVARWSETDCWNSKFSAFLSSPACFKATCMSAISFLRVSSSDSKEAMVFSRPSFLPSKSSFSWPFFVMLSSVWSISWLQKSFFSTSAFCCSFNSAVILSMASLTRVKASRRTRTAREARIQFLCFLATFSKCFIAVFTALFCAASVRAPAPPLEAAEVCTKERRLMKRSRASSCVRILMVSAMATNSSERTLARSAKSSSLTLQFFSRPTRNF
mmetsp:Transcript_102121/g.255913  ORF Transcript_102121/g.255913 Transcript_102121/m.255913 type:complete len:226 (-) Transcript_102121:1220-1897(-)